VLGHGGRSRQRRRAAETAEPREGPTPQPDPGSQWAYAGLWANDDRRTARLPALRRSAGTPPHLDRPHLGIGGRHPSVASNNAPGRYS
jgi:hypothetical protein